ncbi:MAG TPA: hypothetical protein VJ731_11265 [Terriglobales bacterium]|nr:hypothetical protein [Terriglobales bacterium]
MASHDDVDAIRFSLSATTPNRTIRQGSVLVIFVEMRNSSTVTVLASAGYRNPPIELHLWNAHGEEIANTSNSDLAEGTAFRETAARRLVAVRFDPGEKVRFQVYIPLKVQPGDYRLLARTAVQPDTSHSQTAVIVDSNPVPLTVCK